MNTITEVIRIGIRRSRLALKQVEEIIAVLKKTCPECRGEIIGIDTPGDRDKATPLSRVEGSDFFTREIDKALRTGMIDCAVHSAKDLPDIMPSGLTVAALTESIDIFDVLVSRSGAGLDELPMGARVGTSSKRRKDQLANFRNDLEIVDIRGNIEERLKILDRNDVDAIVIAAAGLIRLKLEERITQRIPLEILKPHPLQGSLAVVIRMDDERMRRIISALDLRKGVSA